ncbi:hypothetical protein F511_23593 [Dorcoceras hygrometricum]|uniref:Uncharacterized protein n=1 Tax=Dorcoceras hygrometricum TaxID=472368 RepID=A0A2Z7BQC1_9LAMI|nr:hypothetical protein F511_23593 [Dorcoceras hygrometricum]
MLVKAALERPISGQLNKKGKDGIGYNRPENSKSSGLKNRLDKEKEKAGSKSFVQNQQRRGSKKVKSEWRKLQPRRDLNGQNTKLKLNRSHHIPAHNLMDFHTGKTVKTIAPSSAVPAETESAMENVNEEQRVETTVDNVDEIIAQIISETKYMETDEREIDMVTQSSRTDVIMEETSVVFPTLNFQLFIIEADRMIETGSDTKDEMENPEPLRSGKADNLSGATQSVKSPSTEIADIAPTVDGKTSDVY